MECTVWWTLVDLHTKWVCMQTQEGDVALSEISTHRYFSPFRVYTLYVHTALFNVSSLGVSFFALKVSQFLSDDSCVISQINSCLSHGASKGRRWSAQWHYLLTCLTISKKKERTKTNKKRVPFCSSSSQFFGQSRLFPLKKKVSDMERRGSWFIQYQPILGVALSGIISS